MQYQNALPVSFAYWENETLIYNRASGDTHYFANIPQKLIQAWLSNQCFTTEDLHFCLSVNDSELSKHYISDFVKQLLQLDLIVAISE